MTLTPEWRGRLDSWRKVLKTQFYVELQDVPMSWFRTYEQLTPEQAAAGSFKPAKPGTAWGAKWEYAWLRGQVNLPEAARGERIALRISDAIGNWTLDANGEARVLINGREAGGRSWAHPEITLTDKGVPGETYDILVEAYAGHGPTPCSMGPLPHGQSSVQATAPKQGKVGRATIGIWQEAAYQTWIDLETLAQIRDELDPNSLRVSEIDEGLRAFTLIVDLELPREQMLATLEAGRERLKPLLACRNGSTAPLLNCYGHSHIDVAWLWPLAETERKCARTFASQLALMDEYPEYRFLQSQPHLFRMTQRLYPELYKRIKEAAKRGQFMPEGGMWVEADTNITSGESLIRQFLHGKRFYREEFGVDSKLMWLPDVFGYSGALPQIMDGCGIRYFSTHKIFWTYNGGDPFPHNTFWWEGIDGTRILSHIHNDYNSQTNPTTLIRRWKNRAQKDGIQSMLVPFGWGDGGGGPTRDHLEFLRRQRNLEGCPKTVIASPLTLFKKIEAAKAPLPSYVGELYYQAHRGTYTTQARTKKGNRTCEFALREAEMWAAAAHVLARKRPPAAELDEAWKGVLLNQFHDIIPGSSITRVYEEAEALYAEVLTTARRAADKAATDLTKSDAKALTVFNSLSWERAALVPLPAGLTDVEQNGHTLPTQCIGDTTYAEAPLPACGWTTLSGSAAAQGDAPTTGREIHASPTRLENACLRATFNARGEITSLLDKTTNQELAAAPMNSLSLYKDVPRNFDAWDIDSPYEFQPVALEHKATVEVLGAGPLAGVLRIKRRLNDSELVQDVWLRRDSARLEFRTRIDWHEKHKLLKVRFPTVLQANDAAQEIQFGHLRRPNHKSRPFDADRFEVCNQKWTALSEENRGVAVLNDCKYGVDVGGGNINLTLLRASLAPDGQADQGIQEFTYAFTIWNGSFFESEHIREAYELNVPTLVVPGRTGEGALLQVDAANIVVETIKPAEDGSRDMIVRLYDAKRATTRCTLTTALPVKKVLATNMLEANGKALALKDGKVTLDFRPFEIKTLRLRF